MCFSATVSFVSGTALSIGGAATLGKAKTKSEIPFASIPLLFGIQQLIEGVIWVSFGTPLLNMAATFAYLLFSHVFWPIFLPVSVLFLERDAARRKILRYFVLIGSGVGLYLFYFMVTTPVTAQIVGNSIAYDFPYFYAVITMFLYLTATCLCCLFSSANMVKVFGAALFVSFLIALQSFSATFFSVWCFFAAILSVIVYLHFRYRRTACAARGNH